MRFRPLAALSAAAVAALLLAGCASGQGTAQPTGTAAADLCAAQAAPGAASDSVTVDGEVGKPSKATFKTPLEPKNLQVTVLDEGKGESVKPGQFVSYAMSAYNAKSGDELATVGYKEGEFLPSQLSASTVLGQVFGCGKVGKRVVATFPATDTAQAEVYVLDLLGTVPTAAWGTPQDAPADFPKVALEKNGAPKITIPKGEDPPTATKIATLKKGDGYTVKKGDYALIQYTGVRWSNGKTFDSTWEKGGGTPIAYPTTQYVPGFQKALEGQTVGSQVLVVIPPAEGYGEGKINEADLKGETIVFVVDILGAQSATAGSPAE
ncbi:FKBP-type peptidyl-prolyl cis-trans isomerase [Microbacterium oleivorans]|uniref:FKBP-type peptidyl-prolyl cis-trans isomerase n=1 Tax=Microbacterium oleivorans TaxID=273677 RepID=UPI000766E716|nr:FKBP-type peptidyl-prolyl cis-trans isomerase [Microbacterium oleivorans]AZS44485.1 FK506-binding protein [Microbacterium oleivorans]THE06132.1 FKBP-type peptidyl-prolyl cis-trans isomerase [Microbacterium oleivorans]